MPSMYLIISLRFHIEYLASLALVFVVANIHHLCVVKFLHLVDNIGQDYGLTKKLVVFSNRIIVSNVRILSNF